MKTTRWLKRLSVSDPALDDHGARQMVIGVLSTALVVDVFMLVIDVNAWVMIGFGALLLAALLLAWRGYLTPGRLLVPPAALVMFGFLMFQNFGLRDTAVLGLPMVLLSASLMIGRRGAAIYGLLSVLVVLALGVAEWAGYVHTPLSSHTTTADYVTVSVCIVLITVLQWLIVGRLNDNISNARRNEAAQRVANEALRVSETRQRALLDAIPELVFRLRRDGVFLDYHAPKTDQLATRPETFLGQPVQLVLPPLVAEQARQAIATVLTTGQPAQFEYALPMGDQARYFDARLVISGADEVLATVRDITERKRSEQALHQYVERLTTLHLIDQAILSEQPIGAIAQAALSRIQRLVPNQRAGVILFEPETQTALVAAAVLDGEIKQSNIRFPLNDFEIKAELCRGEIHVEPDIAALREPSPVELSMTSRGIRSYLDAPLLVMGELIGVLGLEAAEPYAFEGELRVVAREVADQLAIAIQQARLFEQTRRHAAELEQRVADRTRELTAANAQLAELDRLKSKFVSDVSHELRTPIANLKLYAGLLERGKPEKQAHYLLVLKQQTQRLSQLVEDILDLSRLEIAKQEVLLGSVDLSAVIDQIVTAHQPRAEAAGLTLTFSPVDDLPPARGDIYQLTQVMTNLIVNALNYTPRGSVHVTLAVQDGQVVARVSDTGQGIAPDDLPHIFERFYRGRHARQHDIPGTGLGLAIVKEIVELHHGTITVDSRLNAGTTFEVRLPVEG